MKYFSKFVRNENGSIILKASNDILELDFENRPSLSKSLIKEPELDFLIVDEKHDPEALEFYIYNIFYSKKYVYAVFAHNEKEFKSGKEVTLYGVRLYERNIFSYEKVS